MKELLKKGDVAGPALAAVTLFIFYWKGGVWSPYHTAGVVAGALLLVLALALKADEIQASLGRRSTKLGIHSFTSILLVLGILSLLNYLGARHVKQVDMTSEGTHTLSQQSIDILGQLQQDVAIKAFYLSGDSEIAARDSLRRYTNLNSKIGVEFVNPVRSPELVKANEIRENGTLLIQMGEKKERIEKERFTEEDITNALVKLVKGETKTIYFLEGHGEKSPTASGRDGASQANKKLADAGYAVKPLNLVREKKVPEDAAVVVVMGPATEPFPTEVDALDEYVRGGGSALIMVDPPPGAAAMDDFAKKWSVEIGENLVIDFGLENQFASTGPVVPLVLSYGRHPITEKMRTYTLYPMARSVTPVPQPEAGLTVTPLLLTSRESWGESDIAAISAKKPVGFDAGKDVGGPVTLGVAVNKDLDENKKSRLVFIGDSDFASDSAFGEQANGDLFINAIAWLSQDDSFITIRPKDPKSHEVTMTASQSNLFLFIVLLLFPGSILLTGIAVRTSRR